MLARITEGKGTEDDFHTLNTRLVKNVNMQQEKFIDAPIIVPGNQMRKEINRRYAVYNAVKNGQKLFLSVSKAERQLFSL